MEGLIDLENVVRNYRLGEVTRQAFVGVSLPLAAGAHQRVAIARALVNDPQIILADEPTGNLDSRTSAEVMAIFQRLNREAGITLIVVTHELDIAAYAHRAIHFKDGRVVKDERADRPRLAEEALQRLGAAEGEEA